MNRLTLAGGRLVDPASGRDGPADIVIEDGVIAAVGEKAGRAGRVLDLGGAVVAPGFVDMHVHLREPGREDEESIATGSAAAAAGGFTAVCAMPNTDPACDTAAVVRAVYERGRAAGLALVLPAGALTRGREGRTLAAIGEMAGAGVRLFTDDGAGVQDARLLRRAMEYLLAFDGICAQHCEDESLAGGGQMHEGEISSVLGLRGVPAEAEEIMLARDLALARMTGGRYHAQHVSTAGAVALLRAAKAAGARVTAEATPHHAVLTDAELLSYDPVFKINPPLRTAADTEAVRAGLADGTIDAIATDHAPHADQEKEAEFELAPPGTTGLETALGVVIGHLVEPGILSMIQAVERLSLAPARILGLHGHGGPVAPGTPANLVAFDPEASWTAGGPWRSRSSNSAWRGKPMKGRVLHTVFEGRLVFSDGRVLEEAVS